MVATQKRNDVRYKAKPKNSPVSKETGMKMDKRTIILFAIATLVAIVLILALVVLITFISYFI